MARTDTLTNFLTDVAGAIKTKKGSQTPIQASTFDTEIANLPSGASLDLREIKFGGSAFTTLPSAITNANWSQVLDADSMFAYCDSLETFPSVNTSNVQYMSGMFLNCESLENVPVLDTSSVINMSEMFANCNLLTSESLDNILQMCANATSYTGTQTLEAIGIFVESEDIEQLDHYQDFIDAGWTTN